MRKLLDNWTWKNKNTIKASGICKDFHLSNEIIFNEKTTKICLRKVYGNRAVVEETAKVYSNEFIQDKILVDIRMSEMGMAGSGSYASDRTILVIYKEKK